MRPRSTARSASVRINQTFSVQGGDHIGLDFFLKILIEDDQDPVSKFKMKFMKTGEYLRPQDLKYCLEKTNFTEEQVNAHLWWW